MKRLVISQNYTISQSETFKKYLNEVNRYPVLSELEEVKYSRKMVQGNEIAKDLMIKCNLRFVISVAKQYTDKYSRIEDLVNEGNIGLLQAINLFDPELENRFISFAVWWIRNAIIEYKNNLAHMVRLPLHKIVKIKKVKNTILKLEQTLIRVPSLNEIDSVLGGDVTEEEISDALNLLDRTESSFDVSGDDGEPIIAPIISPESADSKIIAEEEKLELDNLLNTLGDDEKAIIKALFGIGEWIPQSLEEVGLRFDLSGERIRQIRDKALNKLRNNKLC